MKQTRLIALPLLVAMPILLGSLSRTEVVSGDARLAASIAKHDPAVATGSLDETLSVLAVFSSNDVGEAIAASRRMLRASPEGRRKTTLFVGLSTPVSPRARARVIALGGTIMQVASPGDAANAELARDGSPLRIPSSDFAVLNDLSFSALWGRPIPNERGPKRLFHGRRTTVPATFLHGREYAVAEGALGWQRLVIPLSTGQAEFVWKVDGADGNIPSLLGRPVSDNAYQIYDVVIPRLHRHEAMSLKGALKAFGLGALFAGSAGSGGENITDLVQSTDLAFDERGIHLRADTVAYTTLGVLHNPIRQIVVDRSFWLRISDKQNRSVLVARIDDL